MPLIPAGKQFDIDATRPFYAVVGAGDAAYEIARGYATEVQQRLAKVELDPTSLRAQVRSLVSDYVEELSKNATDAQSKAQSRVGDLQSELQTLPAKVQALVAEYVAELSKNLNVNVEDLNKAYVELAVRGEKFVTRARGGKPTTVNATVETKPAAARRPATKKSTSRPTAKKTGAKKSTAADA